MKASLVCALLGISGLAFVVYAYEPPAVGTIGEKDAGKIVTIGGIVEEVKTVSDTTLMIVNGTKIVSFGNENIKKGERIQATGRVQIYNGEPEIVADSIRKV